MKGLRITYAIKAIDNIQIKLFSITLASNCISNLITDHMTVLEVIEKREIKNGTFPVNRL
jgi:hypothetical protein